MIARATDITTKTGTDRSDRGGERVNRQGVEAWIDEDLVGRTRTLFTRRYGRPVGREEAIDIIRRVASLGDTLRRMAP